MQLVPAGTTVKTPAENFTGDVYLTPVKGATEPSRLTIGLVRFTPGARTNWHSHAVGQTLHCTDGVGLVVNRDGTVLRLTPQQTVWTAPGEEHWHGATVDCMMAHYALTENPESGDATTWLEPVGDEEYQKAQAKLG